MQLREVFDEPVMTGHSFCPNCKKQIDAGYVALVEAAEGFSQPDNEPAALNTPRSNQFCFMRNETFERIFDAAPEKPMAFVEYGTLQKLLDMTQETED